MKNSRTALTFATALWILSAGSLPHALANSRQSVSCVPLPENGFFSELMGITFSPEQAAAYDSLEARVSKMAEERFTDIVTVEIPDSPPSVEMKPGATDSVAMEIMQFLDELIAKDVSPSEQIKQLTERFGVYAKFNVPRAIVFTPEQLERKEQLRRDTEPLMREILTPDQRKVYDANLARRAEIEACEADEPLYLS